jgi:transcriptional regulator with XRE-family HTH domain
LAELIGVTCQQAHKYEKGVNRIAAGRLYTIAQALGVEVGFFYDGIGAEPGAFAPTTKQRRLLELSRSFGGITSQRQQEALCSLARALAGSGLQDDLELAAPAIAETAGTGTTA